VDGAVGERKVMMMNAKREFFISLPVLVLAVIGLYTVINKLLVPLQEIGLSEEVARLIITTILYGVGSLGTYYWMVPVLKRAYPRSFATPEAKIFSIIYLVVLTLNPLIMVGFKQVGLEKSILAMFFTPAPFTILVMCGYFAWLARRNFARIVGSKTGEK
jgi:hypothetical protein